VIIVDDEAPARERLTTLLAAHDVEIVGEAADLPAAIDVCRRLVPDVIFLDIELRGALGFDLLPHLTGASTVIVVSAHDAHGARAQAHGLDFLHKPVNPARLAKSLERAADARHNNHVQ
jgi:DNA-binding LytR/AlgR family response regulator